MAEARNTQTVRAVETQQNRVQETQTIRAVEYSQPEIRVTLVVRAVEYETLGATFRKTLTKNGCRVGSRSQIGAF